MRGVVDREHSLNAIWCAFFFARTYLYSGMGYANPHAVTQIATGLSTSTFTYDNNGNLIQKTVNGTSTTYVWDYANRLIALGVGGAGTTTYGYDAFGARVYQIASTTATTTYPFKFFSVSSSTRSGANLSTTTEYVFNGDTLLATVDQGFRNGGTTGASQTRYIHPDHLGSTNVVTNASGTVVQTLDYYPYGATRVSSNVGASDSARKFIGQFADQSNLDYLNARYYESTRGQFISQDPVFWEIGLSQDGKNALSNPQALNSYGYANDNPITGKDPNGRCTVCAGLEVGYSLFAQKAFDRFSGPSSLAVYGGDIVGAAMYGFAYPYAVAYPEPVAAISAAAGNVAQQGFEYLSGDRQSFDASQVQTAGTVAFGTQLALGSLPIPIISGSALSKQIATKLQRGTISNVSNGAKSAAARSSTRKSFFMDGKFSRASGGLGQRRTGSKHS